MILRSNVSDSQAVFSDDMRHRYLLSRRVGPGARKIGVVGLNPSTADEMVNDPTIRRCIGFAQREHGSELVMTNLFSWRATKPRDLWAHLLDPPAGDVQAATEHGAQREAGLGQCAVVILAFGNFASCPRRLQHVVRSNARELVQRLLLQHRTLWCLATTHDGWPGHPLYLRADAPLLPYTLPPELD